MTTDLRHHLGRVGERLALEHLERLGYRLVAQNHRTRFGEIDLVVCDEQTIVFVEVKARRAEAVAGALDSVPPRKQRQVRSIAPPGSSRPPTARARGTCASTSSG